MSAEEVSWEEEWEAAVESPASTDGTAVDRRMKNEVEVSFILNFLIKIYVYLWIGCFSC